MLHATVNSVSMRPPSVISRPPRVNNDDIALVLLTLRGGPAAKCFKLTSGHATVTFCRLGVNLTRLISAIKNVNVGNLYLFFWSCLLPMKLNIYLTLSILSILLRVLTNYGCAKVQNH